MVSPDDRWRADFERIGEQQVRDTLNHRFGLTNEQQQQAASRWLSEQSCVRREREEQIYQYVRLTYYAAIAVVFVGVIGIIITLIH